MDRRSLIRSAIVEVLAEPKTFNEIYEAVKAKVSDARKIEVREELAKLISEGVVRREPSYERQRMVFRRA